MKRVSIDLRLSRGCFIHCLGGYQTYVDVEHEECGREWKKGPRAISGDAIRDRCHGMFANAVTNVSSSIPHRWMEHLCRVIGDLVGVDQVSTTSGQSGMGLPQGFHESAIDLASGILTELLGVYCLKALSPLVPILTSS